MGHIKCNGRFKSSCLYSAVGKEMEEAIRYYFKKNYQYKMIIITLLEKFHDITISKGTLLNKLKEYGLRRRGNVVDQNRVRECI